MKQQKGFTLVEIAIVLVIIGLLLGGVLKGQEMIESGRVKSAANDFKGISAAYNTYMDQYRAIPGDDLQATIRARGPRWAQAIGGNGNGTLLAGAADALQGTNEVGSFFSTLRAAGLLTGSVTATNQAALPVNPWAGLTGIANANVQNRGAASLLVCMGNVPGKAARILDVQLDDGISNTGSLRATQGTNNANPGGAAGAYNEAQTYTVCRDM